MRMEEVLSIEMVSHLIHLDLNPSAFENLSAIRFKVSGNRVFRYPTYMKFGLILDANGKRVKRQMRNDI